MKALVRETKETRVQVELRPGTGQAQVETGLPFFNHMLVTLARYARLDLNLNARGDLKHHLMEDVAITLGQALARLVPETATRYGEKFIPMDDALVQAVVDVGGRFYYRGKLPNRLYQHFMRSFAEHAKMTLHLRTLRGKDRHHVLEASFKAVGMALQQALSDGGTVFSTKGALAAEVKEC